MDSTSLAGAGSPDVIGFSSGAYSGALVVLFLGQAGYVMTALGAFAGGLLTAAVVYLLAWRDGVEGFRLILIGVAVSAVAMAFNTYLLSRADHEIGLVATAWGTGSLRNLGWRQVGPSCVAVAGLGLAALAVARPLHQLQLGHDRAHAVGVAVQRTQFGSILVAVALTAAVTAVAGPIAFVALSAPQVMRRLTRSAGETVGGGAVGGAALLVLADTMVTALPGGLPVGVMTVCAGGLYLVYLLAREAGTRG